MSASSEPDDPRLASAEAVLREALQVDPSPGLHNRVAADLTAARSHGPAFPIAWAAAAVLAASVGVFVVRAQLSSLTNAPIPSPLPSDPASAPIAALESRQTPRVPFEAPTPRAEVARARTARTVRLDPVLVSPGQAEGLRQLAEMLARPGSVLPPSLLAEEAPEIRPPQPIPIDPLSIEPLKMSGLSFGELDVADSETRSDS